MHLHNSKDSCRFIDFSGSTYQVEFQDPDTKRDIWTFLQLDAQGNFIDGFCDQEETEGLGYCSHLQMARQRLLNGHTLPLHMRFEASLWNSLCFATQQKLGDKPSRLKKKGKGQYACLSSSGKAIFQIRATTKSALAYLKELLEDRRNYTEETSLKFSNLSPEELMLWREGRPSPALKYELSFWSDFAKWLMLLQDQGEKYQIDFGYASSGLPNQLNVVFPEVEMSFYLSSANLPLFIPTLSSVESPLKVYHAPEDEIESIVFDKIKGTLSIIPRKNSGLLAAEFEDRRKDSQGLILDRWLFVPGEGFYARDPHHLLQKKIIGRDEISQLLTDYAPLVKKRLKSLSLHEEPVEPSYSFAFDNDWNLHIVAYLFSPGDLSAPRSSCFDEWAYLEDDGFYRLEKGHYDELETTVAEADLPDFIAQNRAWLNTQEGFKVYLSSVESHLIYNLSDDDRLSFTHQIATKEENGEAKEFGQWIYLPGEGFYSKENSLTGLAQLSGLAINREQIPLFIRANRDDLMFVPGFFSARSPVKSGGLSIIKKESDQIDCTPHFDLLEDYRDKRVRFFDDFCYVAGEGFSELPLELRLPERFRHPLRISNEELEFFLTHELPSLMPYVAIIDPQLVRPDFMRLVATAPGTDLLSQGYLLRMKYETNFGSLPVTKLWSALKSKKKFLFSEAGLFDLNDKRFNWLRWLDKKQVDRRSHIVRLSTIELIRLHALEDIVIVQPKESEVSSAKLLLEELLEFRTPEDPNLEGLQSQLRPYQMIGLKWLWFLYTHRLSGLLCDDMGLGKTHQTMALIAAIRNKNPLSASLPMLVVCPTSVIYHWQEKLSAFLPGLKIYTFYGIERTLENFENNYDLLLTSYGIYRLESENLSKIAFELAIFDEIQIAKNHSSRIYASLLGVNAKMCLGLTGTPIENHLRELKSLFDIVLPLYMPLDADYKEFFVKPIERDGNRERQHLLSRMIKPFVMRRKKEDVLLDLPEKMEEISHCDLDVEQVILYNDLLVSQRQRLVRALEDESANIPYMHIFALLTGLKQICNHPALFLKCPEDYRSHRSGKWELFVELLKEARESQQKVVVYSQYLGMLDIIEEYLRENGVAFAGIRGSTLNRGEQLKRFATDPHCEVFVASLQAAGLGVDLTAASVVIHYDRWWNAAREDQATDRVHRIGQTRGVQVFKLVSKDTFEERIDELIIRKRKLMDDVVGIDDHETIKQFSRHELMRFLKETHTKVRAAVDETD